MKTIKNFLFVIAIAITSSAAFAGGTGTTSLLVDLKPVDENRAIVEIENNTEFNYKISIYDKNGFEVLTDESNGTEPNYKKVYNFKNLEDGSYNMVVTANRVESKNDFQIENNELNIGEATVNVDPYFQQNDDILRVAYLNNTGEKAHISIVEDFSDEKVWEKTLGSDFNVNEAYDISNLDMDNCRVELSVGSKNFYYYFD